MVCDRSDQICGARNFTIATSRANTNCRPLLNRYPSHQLQPAGTGSPLRTFRRPPSASLHHNVLVMLLSSSLSVGVDRGCLFVWFGSSSLTIV